MILTVMVASTLSAACGVLRGSQGSFPLLGKRNHRLGGAPIEFHLRPASESIAILLQPIVDLQSGALVAAEALARFPNKSPEQVFNAAHAAGNGPQLEAVCLGLTLPRRADLPHGVLLSLNLSPDALSHRETQHALACDLNGLIVEITEQQAISPQALAGFVTELRSRGALIAIDDLSTGYAGLLRLTELRPDIVKIDRSLVNDVRNNPDHAAIICALVSLSRRIDARVVAEGVESRDDLDALSELDIDYVQGWGIGRPAQLPVVGIEVASACRLARRSLLAHRGFRSEARQRRSADKLTVAVAASRRIADLHAALTEAATRLSVDVIGLSLLSGGDRLVEVSAAGARLDARVYALADYAETAAALQTNTMREAHIDDPKTDRAERRLLMAHQLASVLISPLVHEGTPLGVLEFCQRTPRRWTRHDLRQAGALSEHVTLVLSRLPKADWIVG